MKKIILDDRKQYLPNLIMFLMTVILLEMVVVFGILTKNSALVSTVFGLYAIIMVIMAVIMLAMTGKVWMSDLRNSGIWGTRKRDGMSLEQVILYKTALYAGMLFLAELLYGIVMILDVLWVYRAFPAEREDLNELFKKLFGENYSLSGKDAVMILEFLMVALAAVLLVFTAVTLVYNGLSRGRYAGVLAGILYVSVGYFVIRLSLSLSSRAKTDTARSLAGSLIMLVIAAICFAVVRLSVKKHQWDAEPQ